MVVVSSVFVLQQMIGEWQPLEEEEPIIRGPPRDNPIVGHIVHRLYDIVHPPTVGQNDLDISQAKTDTKFNNA